MRRREFRQATAWRWLRRNPGAQAPALAEAMGWTPNAASHILQRMKLKGHARTGYIDHRRADRFVIWFAEGDKAPVSYWGTAAGSLHALRMNWDNWESGLKLANEALGRTVKPRHKHPKAVADAHPLSVAWGMMPKSRSCQSSEPMIE